MRRTVVPALALALLPFTAVSPAEAAATATPVVITPGSTSASLTFTVPDPAPTPTEAAVVIHDGAGNEIRREGVDLPLVAGSLAWTWDGRAAGAVVPDGEYTAHLQADGSTIDAAQVRVNLVAPKGATAPTASATSVFPFTDGYRDKVTFTGAYGTSEVPVSASLQVLNSASTVVWTSPSTSATWTGRTNAGAVIPAGTYRVRSRYVDTDGLVGYSPSRALTVSAKRLVTYDVRATISPRAFLIGSHVGKCGKIVRPARKGKAWKRSVAVSSNHKCRRKGVRSLTEAYFGARGVGAYDYRSVKVEAVGAGRTKARKNAAVGFAITGAWNDISTPRRLSPKYGKRTVFRASGSALKPYIDSGRGFSWGVATLEGGRYEIKAFRLTMSYRALVEPDTRGARTVAPGVHRHG